jgi:hypothetical protein
MEREMRTWQLRGGRRGIASTWVQAAARDEKTTGYEFIAHQINREDSLINFRLTWALTLNGFLFAAIGVSGNQGISDPALVPFLHIVVPITGFLISLFGFFGVRAAQVQIDYLRDEWRSLNERRWPRPFGGDDHQFLLRRAFVLGHLSSLMPPLVLMAVWTVLAYSWL